MFGFGKKLEDPVEGVAHVLGVGLPVESQGRVMRIKLQLLVQAPGIEPQQVEMSKMVNRKKVPQAGMVLPITVDRADPTKVEIDWDAAPTRQDLMNAQAQSIIDAGGIGAASTTPHATARPAGAEAADRVAQIERLAALRESGVLTDAEFAAEKSRITEH